MEIEASNPIDITIGSERSKRCFLKLESKVRSAFDILENAFDSLPM